MRYGEVFKHKSLPRDGCLSGDELKKDPERLFEVHAMNASRLAPLGSTKANESFNNIVASKAPKSRHYSASESFNYRLRAAVCPKNTGHSYLSKAFKTKRLSPRKSLVIRARKLQKQRPQRQIREAKKAFKLRRLQLRENRNKFYVQHEVREEPTYETNIGTDSIMMLQGYLTHWYCLQFSVSPTRDVS